MMEKKANLNCNLVASWTVEVGDLDQCLHLWKYTGGFEKIDQAKADLWHDPVNISLYSFLQTNLEIFILLRFVFRCFRNI